MTATKTRAAAKPAPVTAEPADVEATLLPARTCAWCQRADAITTVIVEPARPASDDEPAAAARTARSCGPCAVRLEQRAREEERARHRAEHGSRLPDVPAELTLDQELHRDEHLTNGLPPAGIRPANTVRLAPGAAPGLFPGVHGAPLGHARARGGQA